MSHTFAEKILAKNAGLPHVSPGQIIDATPDVALSHDNSAAISKIFYSLGVDRVKYPARLAITLDHASPPPTTQHAQNHADIRRFVSEQGITHFFDVGRGICHQVLCEEGLIYPGILLLGADSHSTHYGALGAFGAGVGRSEMAAIWATGQLWLRVPESIKITITGSFGPWVTSKDIALHVIGQLGADGGLYASIEFHGQTVAGMSMASRFVLSNMMAEMGAKNSYVTPDEHVDQYLKKRAQRNYSPLFPDPDAEYQRELTYTLDTITAMVACPHSVDHVKPLAEVQGTHIDQAFLGTCTNGRLDDLQAAAEILRGNSIARGTRMVVIPASSEIFLEALKQGLIAEFIEAGAVIESPGCGPCMGNHLGIPAEGEVTISTANRNFRGRMGTKESEIYLANPYVVAASAVAGKIISPEELM